MRLKTVLSMTIMNFLIILYNFVIKNKKPVSVDNIDIEMDDIEFYNVASLGHRTSSVNDNCIKFSLFI
jgi:hypothetical protein